MSSAAMYEAPAFQSGGYPATRYVTRRSNIPGFGIGGYPRQAPTPNPTPTPGDLPPPPSNNIPGADDTSGDGATFNSYDIGGGRIGVFDQYGELVDSFFPQEPNGGSGPDHFYEQMAEEARQFNEGLAFERDQEAALRKQRQYEAALAREQMMQDWRKEQLEAQQRRRQLAVDAASQSQNTFASMLPQMAPGQKLYFNPNGLPDSARDNSLNNPNDQFAAPNIPGLVY